MGGTNSKPKYVTESAVITNGNKPNAETKREVSIWEGKQAPAGMLALLSLPVDSAVLRIIMSYWELDFDEEKTFKNAPLAGQICLISNWSLFSPDPFPAKAADCIAWGNSAELEKIIKAHPHVLVMVAEAKDHRCSYRGTPLQITFQLKDALIKNDQDETMAGMIRRHLIEQFGVEEFKRQVEQIRPLLRSEEKENKMLRSADKIALLTVFQALDASPATDEKNIAADAKLIQAVNEFDRQLRRNGDEKILIEAENLFQDHYSWRGDVHKRNFYEKRVLGLIQLRRLNVWALQLAFYGFFYYSKYPTAKVPRINIRDHAGLNVDSIHKLGFNMIVNPLGTRVVAGGLPGGGPNWPRWTWGSLSKVEKYFLDSNINVAEFMKEPGNPKNRAR